MARRCTIGEPGVQPPRCPKAPGTPRYKFPARDTGLDRGFTDVDAAQRTYISVPAGGVLTGPMATLPRTRGWPKASGIRSLARVRPATDAAAAFEQIRLYRNGELLETRPVSGNPVQAIFSDPVPLESAYYYVIVTETVDRDSNGRKDEAITAPIWIGEPWGKPACGATSLFCQPVGDIGTIGDLFVLISSLIVLIVTQTLAGTIGNNSPPKSIYEYSE